MVKIYDGLEIVSQIIQPIYGTSYTVLGNIIKNKDNQSENFNICLYENYLNDCIIVSFYYGFALQDSKGNNIYNNQNLLNFEFYELENEIINNYKFLGNKYEVLKRSIDRMITLVRYSAYNSKIKSDSRILQCIDKFIKR